MSLWSLGSSQFILPCSLLQQDGVTVATKPCVIGRVHNATRLFNSVRTHHTSMFQQTRLTFQQKASWKNQLILKSSDFVFDRRKGHEGGTTTRRIVSGLNVVFHRDRKENCNGKNRQRRERYSEQNLLGVKRRQVNETRDANVTTPAPNRPAGCFIIESLERARFN